MKPRMVKLNDAAKGEVVLAIRSSELGNVKEWGVVIENDLGEKGVLFFSPMAGLNHEIHYSIPNELFASNLRLQIDVSLDSFDIQSESVPNPNENDHEKLLLIADRPYFMVSVRTHQTEMGIKYQFVDLAGSVVGSDEMALDNKDYSTISGWNWRLSPDGGLCLHQD